MGLLRKLALTLALPVALLWHTVATVLAVLLTLTYVPRRILLQRFYWALPFARGVWATYGRRGWLVRQAFEVAYTINVLRRVLSVPVRRRLPDFYILGFPEAGTTSLANRLRDHPAMLGIDGVRGHEALRKESHFFAGCLGKDAAHQPWLYRSFFPTLVEEWWAECVRGVSRSLFFDACPVFACLPYTAERIRRVTPDAKLIFMIREPVSALFSTEVMLRNLGHDVPWTLMEAYQGPSDPRLAVRDDEAQLWKQLENLGPTDPLPDNLPELFYNRIGMAIRGAQTVRGVRPFVERFQADRILFISFDEYRRNEEAVVKEVISFVGADPSLYKHRKMRPGMQSEYRGRQMHPTMQVQLRHAFAPWNQELFRLIGQTLNWADEER